MTARAHPPPGVSLAAAIGASDLSLHRYRHAGPTDRIGKIDFNLELLIDAVLRPPPGLRRSAATEEVAKKISQVLEAAGPRSGIAEVDAKAAGVLPGRARPPEGIKPRAGAAVDATKGVVLFAFVRVRQIRVRLLDLFEFLFRIRIVRVDIGVKLARQFAIRLFDLGGIRRPIDPEDSVIIDRHFASNAGHTRCGRPTSPKYERVLIKYQPRTTRRVVSGPAPPGLQARFQNPG